MGKALTPGLDSVRQVSNSTLIFAIIISKLKRERKARKKFIHYLKKITYGPYNYLNRINCDFRTYLFINLKIRNEMKQALKIIGKILYVIIALSPIFFLGYLLGIKLLEQ